MEQNINSKTHKHSSQNNSYTRRDFFSTSLKASAAAFTTGLLPKLRANGAEQYNVLFIMVDDLRPMLGCYGHTEIHTPNIDRIAQRGTIFNRAYCQYPLCNPSRVSILTGLRPDTTKVFSNKVGFREKLPDVVTLPQHFKLNGYHTQGIGKIANNRSQNDVSSWSVPTYKPLISYKPNLIPSWQSLDVEDDELADGKTARHTARVLEEIQNKKFFLTVGFHKPHWPFHVPKKYYDLYEGVKFDPPSSSTMPKDTPAIANVDLGAFSEFQDIPKEGPLSETKTLELIHAYAAATSYMDAQIGRVLDQLDALQLTEKTVIVFASDHGFHVGDHGVWRKYTLFDVSLRSPLIVSIPGQANQGVKSDALTELVDIYPTLCDACQIPKPLELEGISMIPVFEKPNHPWKTAVFSQKGRNIGNSIRTDQYRYTEWGNNGRNGKELYDYHTDPNETENIANLPENKEIVGKLSNHLNAGWQAALPEI